VRRRLARDAARAGWSVRETENRAKLAGQPRKGRSAGPALGPEEETAFRAAADELESALGHEVTVKPRRGHVSVEIHLDDLEQARALARGLRVRQA
jgi:ParB family chromosome partitioning protein